VQSWLKYILLTLVIVILFGGGPLYIYLYILFFTVLLTQTWAQLALLKVQVKREVACKGYFIGEEIKVKVVVKNTGLLPVLWVYVEENVPQGLAGREQKRVLSLPAFSNQTYFYKYRARQRGLYYFNPFRLIIGDLLGLYHYQKEFGDKNEIIIYPNYQRVIFQQAGLWGLEAIIKTQLSFVPDPMTVFGSRDYRRGDPLNLIDWKATARADSLKIRQSEYYRSLSLAILLNGNLLDYQTPLELEEAIEVAASMAKWLLDSKGRVGLYSNGRDIRHMDDRKLPVVGVEPKNDPEQFLRILTSLATLHVGHSFPFNKLLERVLGDLSLDTALLIISASISEEMWPRIVQAKQHGKQIWILVTRPLKKIEHEQLSNKAKSTGVKVIIKNLKREVGDIVLEVL